jgi:hypothetical protein
MMLSLPFDLEEMMSHDVTLIMVLIFLVFVSLRDVTLAALSSLILIHCTNHV